MRIRGFPVSKNRKIAQKSRPIVRWDGSFDVYEGIFPQKELCRWMRRSTNPLAARIQAVAVDSGVCRHLAAFIKIAAFAVYPVPAGGHTAPVFQIVPGIADQLPAGLHDAAFAVIPLPIYLGPTGDIAVVGGLEAIAVGVFLPGVAGGFSASGFAESGFSGSGLVGCVSSESSVGL